MENLDKIIELADNEFGAVARNGKFRSRDEIDSVYKLMDIVKDAYCIMDMEPGYGGYSERGDSYDDGRSMRGGSYRGSYVYDDGSYARGRGRNAKRDSMGRYARDGGYRSYAYRGYSRDEAKEDYMGQLRELMESAPDEQTRNEMKRMVDQMQ